MLNVELKMKTRYANISQKIMQLAKIPDRTQFHYYRLVGEDGKVLKKLFSMDNIIVEISPFEDVVEHIKFAQI